MSSWNPVGRTEVDHELVAEYLVPASKNPAYMGAVAQPRNQHLIGLSAVHLTHFDPISLIVLLYPRI